MSLSPGSSSTFIMGCYKNLTKWSTLPSTKKIKVNVPWAQLAPSWLQFLLLGSFRFNKHQDVSGNAFSVLHRLKRKLLLETGKKSIQHLRIALGGGGMPCFLSVSLAYCWTDMGWVGRLGGVGVGSLLLDRCQQPLSLKGWRVNKCWLCPSLMQPFNSASAAMRQPRNI